MPLSTKKVFIPLSILAALFLAGSYTIFTQSASGKSCVEPPSGLVSWWSGDTISGKTLSDIKGKNNGTLSLNYGITSVPGKVDNAIQFGGTTGDKGQYNLGTGPIKIGNPTNLNFGSGPFSLEVWFNWEGSKIGGGVGEIIRKSTDSGSSPGPGYWLRVVATKPQDRENILEFQVGDLINVGNAVARRATTPIVPRVWYHAVATLDHDIMKLYLNGELKSTVEMKGTPEVLDAKTTSNAQFFIGGSEQWNFRGFIDEVSVYKKALSQSEVQSIFNAGSAGKCKSSITPETPEPQTPEPSKPPVSVSPTPAILSDITYPVKELGNCGSQQDCKAYCSVPSNYSNCATFAQKNNLSVLVPAVFAAMQKGESPGQCKDEVSCRKYCEDVDHINECSDFIEKFNLASSKELKEIRKVATAKKAGVSFPGSCKNKASCLAYCENSAHAVECMEFALKAGFIAKEDVESVSKIIPYLKSGGKLPGGCTTKELCDAYCNNDAHTNECVDFAVGAGFMPKEDADIVKKTGGKGPGNCRSREACDSYCKDETHINECVDFAVKAGFISEADAADAKKYKITSGPGNCKNKADCEAFCVLPENQDTCFKFAKDHGMISEEDLKNIEQYRNQGPPDFSQVNPKWLACMEKEMGPDIFGRFKAGKSNRPDFSVVQTAQKKCQSEMGPDIRKEIEACLSKTTCVEFNSCFDALPKGNQQSNQQSSGQGSQDESGKKIQARVSACFQEKIDACLALSCSEFTTCMKSFQQGGQGGGKQGTGNQGQQQKQGSENPKVNAKIQTCQKELTEIKMKEIQGKIDACLALSCSEFDSCIKSIQQGGGEQGGQQQKQGQGAPDPKVNAKVQACQKEKINSCLSKPCSEFQACLNSLGGGSNGFALAAVYNGF